MSLGLPSFRLHRPRRLEDALLILGEHGGGARILAGGTDLVVNLRQRLLAPAHVVALGAVEELAGLSYTPEEGLRIGALVTIAELAAAPAVRELHPVLAQAAAAVSGPTLRSMGTVGGNLCLDTRCQWYNQSLLWREACGFCLKKDGTACHVAPGSDLCWAAASGDLAPALLVLEAEVVIRRLGGERTVALADFYLEDGVRKFDLRPDEILSEVRVPPHRAGLEGFYGKLRARGSIDYPLAAVAVAGRVSPAGRFQDVGVAVTALGPRPLRIPDAAEAVEGRSARDDDAVLAAAQAVERAANPLRTGGALPPAYRRLRAGLFARDGLRALAAGA
jgi:4-hydroxybenzoyl-CoA reductase subunit beta